MDSRSARGNERLQKMALQIAGRRELRGVVIKGN
jgi:hypothetical protein